MNITLTKELESYVKRKVSSGRYADASDVLRDALRTLAQRDEFEPPALEEAVLAGVRSTHKPWGQAMKIRIRKKPSLRA
jgi:putative addiction module CopG family antidote